MGFAEVCDRLVVGGAEHRTDEATALWRASANGEDAAQTAWARAADEAHEDCFELIVGMVCGRDVVGVDVLGDVGEGVVSSEACVGFDVSGGVARMDVSPVMMQGPSLGEIRNELCIVVGFVAQVVVDVGDVDVERPFVEGGEGGGGEEEGDGIGTAAACDEDAIACADAAAGEADFDGGRESVSPHDNERVRTYH